MPPRTVSHDGESVVASSFVRGTPGRAAYRAGARRLSGGVVFRYDGYDGYVDHDGYVHHHEGLPACTGSPSSA